MSTGTADGFSFGSLCLNGSLYGQAAKVMSACEKAVALNSEYGDYRRSRVLVRALAGNTPGAIADFEFVVERAARWWQKDEKQQAQGWIEALKKGENPLLRKCLRNCGNNNYKDCL